MIPAAHLFFCKEKAKLIDTVATTAGDYAKLANELAFEVGMLSRAAYGEKLADVGKARASAQQAREALQAHKKQHGC